MEFVKVGHAYVNMDKVAKVKAGPQGLTVVYSDENIMASRFTGEDARDLRAYLDSIAVYVRKEAHERVQ